MGGWDSERVCGCHVLALYDIQRQTPTLCECWRADCCHPMAADEKHRGHCTGPVQRAAHTGHSILFGWRDDAPGLESGEHHVDALLDRLAAAADDNVRSLGLLVHRIDPGKALDLAAP